MESLWIKTQKNIIDENKTLKEKEECDVCIIGGGITGITTAYYLSKLGKKVIILERDKIAMKTSGNTTAKITSQHGLFYKYLIDNYGKEYAKEYYNANQEAIENISKIIKEEKIECDFERQSSYVFTKNEIDLIEIKDEVKAVKSIGGEAEYIETIEVPIKDILRSNKIPKSGNVQYKKIYKRFIR